MSILDDAIREHLELKRAHGADDSELQRLEDEAFGPPQRPDEVDPFAEEPTEFLLSPEEGAADLPEIGDEAERSGRRPNITDLQEPPPPEAPAPEGPAADLAPPADEEHPAGEHEIVPDLGPDTQERHVIADQPTQMFDVQAEMDAEAEPPAEQASPTDEQLIDAGRAEPLAAPPAPEEGPVAPQPPLETHGPDAEVAGGPPAEAEPEEDSTEYDFFNEQRLADELDQALDAPIAEEHGLPDFEDAAPPAEGELFDFESQGEGEEEAPSEEAPAAAPEPPSEEAPGPERPSEEAPLDSAESHSEDAGYAFDPDTGHEDVLEDTPTFLEDAPEDDDLWFEQKPPKDFDLD